MSGFSGSALGPAGSMSVYCVWVRWTVLTGISHLSGRLVGLVVKASASRAEDPGFESPLRRDFFSGSSHTRDLKIGTPVASLPGVKDQRWDWSAWCQYTVTG